MPFQEIPQSSFGQQLGARIGQGLSEGIPKAIDQFRLSSGLKKIGKGNLSPIQQFQALIQAGADPQMIHQLLPLIQQQAEGSSWVEEGNQGGSSPQGSPLQAEQQALAGQEQQLAQGNAPQVMAGQPQAPQQMAAAQTPAERLEKLLITNTNQESLAKNLFNTRRPEFPTKQAAMAEAGRLQKMQQAEISDFETGFEKRIAENLEKDPGAKQFEDLMGESKGRYRDEYLSKVLSGEMSPAKAARDAANKAFHYSQVQNKLRQMGKGRSFFDKFNRGATKADLREIAREYRNLGEQDVLSKQLQSNLGISASAANAIAYPVEGQMKSFLEKVPSRSSIFKGGKGKDVDARLKKGIMDNLGNRDSVLSIMNNLEKKGYPPAKVKQILSEINQQNPEFFSQRQRLELTQPLQTPSIADYYYLGLRRSEREL